MIDPENVTIYDMDHIDLEEHILFWALVAGKTADVVAKALGNILAELHDKTGRASASRPSPFASLLLYRYMGKQIRPLLKRHGIGCHGSKAITLTQLMQSSIDLTTCTLGELIAFHGIGLKTAACFLLHTRRDSTVAGLDTHMLAELRDRGYQDAPRSTPQNLKAYEKWSAVVCDLAKKAGMTLPEFDLHIFRKRHRRVGRDPKPEPTTPKASAPKPTRKRIPA
jgi:thermostable 8-oxoguanine DNA glycosylase